MPLNCSSSECCRDNQLSWTQIPARGPQNQAISLRRGYCKGVEHGTASFPHPDNLVRPPQWLEAHVSSFRGVKQPRLRTFHNVPLLGRRCVYIHKGVRVRSAEAFYDVRFNSLHNFI